MELAGKSLFSKPLRSLNQTNGRVPKQGGSDCAKGMPTCHLGVTRRELIQGSKVVLDQGRVERMGIEEGGNRRALPSDLAAEMGLEVLLELVLVIGDGSRVDA